MIVPARVSECLPWRREGGRELAALRSEKELGLCSGESAQGAIHRYKGKTVADVPRHRFRFYSMQEGNIIFLYFDLQFQFN